MRKGDRALLDLSRHDTLPASPRVHQPQSSLSPLFFWRGDFYGAFITWAWSITNLFSISLHFGG